MIIEQLLVDAEPRYNEKKYVLTLLIWNIHHFGIVEELIIISKDP